MEFPCRTPPHTALGCEMLPLWTDLWVKTLLWVLSIHLQELGIPGTQETGSMAMGWPSHKAGRHTTGAFAGLCHTCHPSPGIMAPRHAR